jgi:hypothetical protein
MIVDPFSFLDAPIEEVPAEETPPAEQTETEEITETDTESVSEEEVLPETEPEEDEVKAESEAKTAKAFAEMRVSLSRYDKFFKSLGAATGLSEEDVMNKLLTDVQTKEAKEKNLDPEALAIIQKQQEELNTLRQRELDNAFVQNVTSFQKELGLSESERDMFFQQAVDLGVDLFNPPMDFKLIYKAVNYDKLVQKEIDKAVQETIKLHKKADSATTPGSSKGADTGGGAETEITTVEALNRLLK